MTRAAILLSTAVEMANLSYTDTGIYGYVIRISTKEGKHYKPRIKLAKRAHDMRTAATSILVDGDNSRIYTSNDNSNASDSVKNQAIEFAKANTETLTRYWNGETLLRHEVTKLLDTLIPAPYN